VISPVPVTLKRFLALELVLTFGIIIIFYFYTLAGVPNRRELMEPCGQYVFRKNPLQSKHKILKGLQKYENFLGKSEFITANSDLSFLLQFLLFMFRIVHRLNLQIVVLSFPAATPINDQKAGEDFD
jgi:hypothetical protein